MELRDFIVTPFVIFFVYTGAYIIRDRVTDPVTRKYYFPALSLKIFGALALGFVYQFYYNGGDTFAYHTHGSRHIWEAFMETPERGFKLLFSDGKAHPGYWGISDKIWYFRDQKSFFIVRIATVLDLITFSSYCGTAVLFAVISFIGGWMLFLTFYKRNPGIHKWIAVSCLFVPSVIFWGSGILKDTVTLAFLGIATYCVSILFIERTFRFQFFLLLLFSCYVIFSIKVYILMSFLIAAMVWVLAVYFFSIRSMAMRIMVIPLVIAASVTLSFVGIRELVKDDPKYSFDKLAETVRVTAYDIRYWTGKDAQSGYTLGELDGSVGSVVVLAPSAINVSLFRPYLWEVKNPLMLLAALESIITLLITFWVLIKAKGDLLKGLGSPETVFCLTFALMFAFGVGVSSYNFGTLGRYKIPLYPYYFCGLGMLLYRVQFIRLSRQQHLEMA
jgi:hypothetical protein